jgi:hypothetical protein
MKRLDSLKDLLTHPVATASYVFAIAGSILNVPFIDALWSVAWANAGALFTFLSVPAFTIAPRVPWLPAEPLSIAAIAAGVLFAATRLDKLLDALKKRLKEIRK